jgi:hypothetical protein
MRKAMFECLHLSHSKLHPHLRCSERWWVQCIVAAWRVSGLKRLRRRRIIERIRDLNTAYSGAVGLKLDAQTLASRHGYLSLALQFARPEPWNFTSGGFPHWQLFGQDQGSHQSSIDSTFLLPHDFRLKRPRKHQHDQEPWKEAPKEQILGPHVFLAPAETPLPQTRGSVYDLAAEGLSKLHRFFSFPRLLSFHLFSSHLTIYQYYSTS